MGIRNDDDGKHHPQRCLAPYPPDVLSSSLLQPPPSPSPKPTTPTFSPTKDMMKMMFMTTSSTHDYPLSFSPYSDNQQVEQPHVMVSRINPRLSSSFHNNGSDYSEDAFFNDPSRPFAPDYETPTTDDNHYISANESFGHEIFGQTSSSCSVSSSLSFNGRWCEEERAIPLKKRRVVMMVNYETNQSKKEEEKKKNDDALKVIIMTRNKQDQMEELACNKQNGKGWRCKEKRVKGRSLCKHHLESQRKRKAAAAGRVQVKARSMTSLLRDTVSLFYN